MKNILFTSLLACAGLMASAQVSLVSPLPHKVTEGAVFNLCDQPLTIVAKGVVGDKAVKKYAKLVPAKAEGYYLNIDAKGHVVLVGRDARGLYYAEQTLEQITSKDQAQECTIQDWPDVMWRGVVEGFYGRPWSHEHRLRQLDFYGKQKMNVYIYGPKDDPYHRKFWREPYPEKEAALIKELAEKAKESHVQFYWAIHPGVDIKWTTEDRDLLVAKLEKMYDLGVRSFAVFFDDIWGEGAKADKQAALLNHVDEVFVQKKGDVSPLVLCPTEYNKSWANDQKGYLRTLGSQLHKGIEVMWTGNTVVHCIDKPSMEWINERIQRKGYIWWNFPVNDFVRDHMLLGPAYGNGLDIADMVSGFVSNPMQYAESSKISLYNIADYTWNMQAYNYEKSWEDAIKYVMPDEKAAAALRTFALNNEDLGPNGHGFRREESRHLVPLAEQLKSDDRKAVGAAVFGLREELSKLSAACNTLLATTANPWLTEELRPWILQCKNIAEYGQRICQMSMTRDGRMRVGGNRFGEQYDQVKALARIMYDLDTKPGMLHEYQTGIKSATRVLLPMLNDLFAESVKAYNEKHGTDLDPVAEYVPFKISSDVHQLAQLTFRYQGGQMQINPVNEVVEWPAGAAVTITADREVGLGGLDFNLGTPNIADKFSLVATDSQGREKTISLLHYKEGEEVVHTGNEINGTRCKTLRLINTSGVSQKVFFRSFRAGMK
ncbi:MAG: beta-N-acetylglucosaminidase domain-containing protein [Bacteroidaceae bacterium]|nr:beta-N-acetylglucosaminidase domain-containing protein [Bacteroidaceae bacterium]